MDRSEGLRWRAGSWSAARRLSHPLVTRGNPDGTDDVPRRPSPSWVRPLPRRLLPLAWRWLLRFATARTVPSWPPSCSLMAAALHPPLRSSQAATLRSAALAVGVGAVCGAEGGVVVEGEQRRRGPVHHSYSISQAPSCFRSAKFGAL